MSGTIRDEHIELAVARGILSAEQASRLRDLAREDEAGAAARIGASVNPDDERFRLIGGFNDVFVTIGVGLLVSALISLASALGFVAGFSLLALVAAWGLSEVFAKRMRLALPSIALALMFAGAGAFIFSAIVGGLISADDLPKKTHEGLMLLASGLGAAIAAGVHGRRFRVPIDAAIIAGGLVWACYGALLIVAPDFVRSAGSRLSAPFGLAIFAVAVWVDAGDPQRLTRRSDVAFWLHLLAAPMIVHAITPQIMGPDGGLSVAQALGVLLTFMFLGLVAIVIDRRALLVSGLSYAGFAIAYLLSQSAAKDMSLSLTLAGLAVFVLGLSVGWRALRSAIVPAIPLGNLRRFIPPTHEVAAAGDR